MKDQGKKLWYDHQLIKISFYVALVLILLYLAAGPTAAIDLWMHLAVGRTIWQSQSIPAADLFCYPSLNHPYIYFEWLYQVGLYLSYQAFGVYSFDLIKFLLWSATLLFFYLTLRLFTPSRGLHLMLTLLAALWLKMRVGAAPDCFGYLFFSIFLYLIILYRQGGKNLLWLLPLLQILWINMHLSALLGPVLVGFALLEELLRFYWSRRESRQREKAAEPPKPRLRSWLMLLGSLFLASLVTPYFHKILTFILFYGRHQEEFRHGIVEWLPIYKFSLLYPYLLTLLLLTGSLIRGRRALSPFAVFCLLSFSALPFLSARFYPYAVLGALPFLVLGFPAIKELKETAQEPILPKKSKKKAKDSPEHKGAPPKPALRKILIPAVLLMVLLGGNGLLLLYLQEKPKLAFGFNDFLIPRGAADFLEKEPLPGRMFNYLDFGGYLEWRLYPRVMPFIDARVPNPALFTEFLRIMQQPANAEKLLEKYDINYIVTRSLSYRDGRLWPIIAYLEQSPQWALIFADDRSLIFLRRLPANQPWLEKYELPKEKLYEEIIAEIAGFKALGQEGGFWDWSLAYAYFKSGKYPEAKEVLRRWVSQHPEHQEARVILQEMEKY